jgi:hypothetical protein
LKRITVHIAQGEQVVGRSTSISVMGMDRKPGAVVEQSIQNVGRLMVAAEIAVT